MFVCRKVARDKPHLRLDVVVLPPKCDDEQFVKSLNDKPGLLALAMEEVDDGKGGKTLKGIPCESSYSTPLQSNLCPFAVTVPGE